MSSVQANVVKTIMVVDDDESVRSFLQFSLEAEGFKVLEARDATTALNKLAVHTPQLILLDIMMPGMDGFTLCSKIKEQPRLAQIPVLFITAYADKSSLGKAAEVRAQGLIEKPIMFSELLLQVTDALNGRFSLPTRLKYSAEQQ